MEKITSKLFRTKIAPELKQLFGSTNVNEVPKIVKVTINAGLGRSLKDARFIEAVEMTLKGLPDKSQ